jgi:hypothetical protein
MCRQIFTTPTARSDTVAFILPSIPDLLTLVGALATARERLYACKLQSMSGVGDSGRVSGHGNINANDPTRTSGLAGQQPDIL